MIYNPREITFVHVKKGFKNTIHDLTAQMPIAAKRIRETTQNDFKIFKSAGKSGHEIRKKQGIQQ